jgi:hypothetical protein
MGVASAEQWEVALVCLRSTPQTGASSRTWPPLGAFLIPRPLAVVGYVTLSDGAVKPRSKGRGKPTASIKSEKEQMIEEDAGGFPNSCELPRPSLRKKRRVARLGSAPGHTLSKSKSAPGNRPMLPERPDTSEMTLRRFCRWRRIPLDDVQRTVIGIGLSKRAAERQIRGVIGHPAGLKTRLTSRCSGPRTAATLFLLSWLVSAVRGPLSLVVSRLWRCVDREWASP